MNPYSLSTLLFTFGLFLIAVLALVRKIDHITLRFAIFSALVTAWGTLYTVWTGYRFSYETTFRLVVLSEIFAVWIPVMWVHFVLEFVGHRPPFRQFYPLNYFFSAFLAVMCPTPLFFKGLHTVPVFHYYKSPGPLLYIFMGYFVLSVLYAFYHLFSAFLEAKGEKKTQLGYLLIGWGFSFAGGISTFLPAFHITNFYFLLFFMPLYAVFIGIALTRYGLTDIQKIIDAFQRDKMAAIGALSASINHEIRNPLYIVQGLTESCLAEWQMKRKGEEKTDIEKKTAETLRKTSQYCRKALDIVHSFNKLAKDGGENSASQPICIRQSLKEVMPLIAHELSRGQIQLKETFAMDVSRVRFNQQHLEQVLLNVLVNSCQAIREARKGGNIEVAASRHNGSIMVTVSDDGPGIPPEKLDRLFEPFYTTRKEGTGLGLHIAKQLLEKHGGGIKVHSSESGTKVVLKLPRA